MQIRGVKVNDQIVAGFMKEFKLFIQKCSTSEFADALVFETSCTDAGRKAHTLWNLLDQFERHWTFSKFIDETGNPFEGLVRSECYILRCAAVYYCHCYIVDIHCSVRKAITISNVMHAHA